MLPMLLVLPLLESGTGFYASLAISVAVMLACQVMAILTLARFGLHYLKLVARSQKALKLSTHLFIVDP